MAVGAEPGPSSKTTDHPLRYRLYGLDVSSEIRLPALPLEGEATAGAWTFRRDGTAEPKIPDSGTVVYEQPCPLGCHVDIRLRRVNRLLDLWDRAVGTFRIDLEARQVTIYAEPNLDERYLAMALIGQVSSLILHHLRIPVLHSSAVVTGPGHAIAFLGSPTHGKSTLAACFMRRGARLLTDDALPLRLTAAGVEGIAGPPIMKMWPAAAAGLDMSDRLTDMVPDFPKKLVTLDRRARFAGESAPIEAVLILSRYQRGDRARPRVELSPLSQRESLVAVLGHIWNSRFLESRDLAALMPIYSKVAKAISVSVLRYPDGFEYQDAVHALVSAELEART